MKTQFEISVVSSPIKIDADGDPIVEHDIKLKINLDTPQHMDPEINRQREEKLLADIWSAIISKIENH